MERRRSGRRQADSCETCENYVYDEEFEYYVCTASLDEDTIWDLFHLLGEFNRLGTTIIMATHAKKFVDLMRKRVITLVDGKVLGDVQKGRYGDVV